ncbi:FadR/GntR family transcriptional regulator [Brachybacterium huguangmaarense]
MTAQPSSAPRSAQRPDRAAPTLVQRIEDLILDEGLGPGDSMPTEPELCERLGVSRSSVREAMRTLASLDIVEVRHGHGTFVGRLSLSPLVDGLLFRARMNHGNDLRTLREVVQIRIALDLAVADELVERYRDTPMPELPGLVDAMRARTAEGKGFAEEDSAFHAALMSLLDNELVQQLGHAFWQIHTIALPALGIAPSRDILDTVDAHRAMLDALAAADVDAYREAVIAHYRPLQRVLESRESVRA